MNGSSHLAMAVQHRRSCRGRPILGEVSNAPRVRRKESFDAAASDYALYRSGYPDEVVDDVLTASRLHAGSRVLEIGCGTGQLSVPLAQHGAELVAVELGPKLAAIARRSLAGFPTARVEVSGFEEWPLPADPFDMVVSASALHWIDPSVRYAKPARALKPGGVLVVVHAHHVKGGTPGFFGDTQRFYQRWGLSDDPSFEPPAPDDVPVIYPELDERSEFGRVQRHRFEIPRRHTTVSYVGWLKTDSLILSLDPQARQGFLNDIEELIDTKYDGRVSRNFVYEVIAGVRNA
jgi:SAM-dependent methyltransferase